EMRIVEARDHAPPAEIHHARQRMALEFVRVVDPDDLAVADDDLARLRVRGNQCRDLAIAKNQVGRRFHRWGPFGKRKPCAARTSTGMAAHSRTATIPPATTPATSTSGSASRRRGTSNAGTATLTGQTTTHVRRAIFQCGGGASPPANQAPSP